MSKHQYIWVVVGWGLLFLSSCQGFEPATKRDVVEHPEVSAGPRTDLPAPPGLDFKALQLLRGEALDRAQETLEQVLAGLPRPSYLPDDAEAGDGAVTTQPVSQVDPPLAAQRAYLAGREQLRDGNNFKAVRHLEEALRLAPKSYEINRLLGMIHFRTGNPVRGTTYLEKSVALNPNDVESLLLLGRQAVSGGRWSEAIAILSFAAGLESEESDPAFAPLTQYLLGSALVHEGYDLAGIGQLLGYLRTPWQLERTTRLARELVVLDRQRSSTWQVVGDAYHRLGQYEEALKAYGSAAEAADGPPTGELLPRLAYCGLRLGQEGVAQGALLAYMGGAGADVTALNMARYLAQQTRDRPGLLASLRDAYEHYGQPESLALVVADLMTPAQAKEFLGQHLDARPQDSQVFGWLVRQELGDNPAAPERAGGAVELMCKTVARLPSATEPYARIVVSSAKDPRSLVKGIRACRDAVRRRPLVGFVLAKALAASGQRHEAIEQLRAVIKADGGLTAAKIELAGLLIEDGQYGQAQELLEGLGDSTDSEAATLRVRLLRLTGRAKAAMELLETLIQQQPMNSQLVLEKAQLQIATGDVSGAEATLVGGLNDHPLEEEIYRHLIALYESGRIANASAKYQVLRQKMLEKIPGARLTRLHKARGLIAGEEYDLARPLLTQLLLEDPSDLEALDTLLLVLVKQDARAEADRMVEERLEADPDDRQVLTVALQHYRRIEDQEHIGRVARPLLGQLLRDETLDARSADFLAQLLDEAGDGGAVDRLLEPALAQRPSEPGLLWVAQRHYRRTKDKPRLIAVTERYLLAQPDSPERTESLATLYLRARRPGEAARILLELWERPGGEESLATVVLLGRALYEVGDAAKAEEVYQQAVGRFPQRANDLKFQWAMLFESLGHRERFEQLLSELLAQEPGNPMANNALGYTWAAGGKNLDQAREMIQRALDADPSSAAYLDSMGWVLFQSGKFEEAGVWLKRAAAAEHGDHPVILDHLGDALFRAGQSRDAVSIWRQALDRYQEISDDLLEAPDDPEMKDLDRRLREKIRAASPPEPQQTPEHAEPSEAPAHLESSKPREQAKIPGAPGSD